MYITLVITWFALFAWRHSINGPRSSRTDFALGSSFDVTVSSLRTNRTCSHRAALLGCSAHGAHGALARTGIGILGLQAMSARRTDFASYPIYSLVARWTSVAFRAPTFIRDCSSRAIVAFRSTIFGREFSLGTSVTSCLTRFALV